MDFFSQYIMGSVQMLFGFYILAGLLHKKVRLYCYFIFAVCAIAVIHFVPEGTIAEFGAFVLLLVAGGILICRADFGSAGLSGRNSLCGFIILYAALVVDIMQLSYGIVKSLLSIFFPLMYAFDRNTAGIVFMVSGELLSLFLTGVFCYLVWRYFSHYEGVEKQYLFLVFIPVLMIFIMDEYINSFVYGYVVTDRSGVEVYAYTNHYQMLALQLLELASLFCILFSYKKLLQNFRLSTELSLLAQEEHSLNRYVEEAKSNYEKTRSFRHDIKNHITVVKELLQNDRQEQALQYIKDMEELTEELLVPCSTNNPVVDILVGNKLGIARRMGIDAVCSLILPYPCGLRDIDICIILSNALDNALCACENMDAGAEKYIYVSGCIQGDFLMLEIENSFWGEGEVQQGTGLSNVKAVVEKYHGAMSIKTQEQRFILNVLLIIPQQQEGSTQQTEEQKIFNSR